MEDDPMTENEYVPFVINRTFSYFPDTVMYANELNTRSHLDNKLQFDYLLNSIRLKKRFSRWLKPEKNADIDAIKEYYSCSYRKAHEKWWNTWVCFFWFLRIRCASVAKV